MKYTDDSSLPELTEERFRENLQKARTYTVVILKAGPRFKMPGPDGDPEITAIIMKHGKRNMALRAAGIMPIVCPIGDGSGVTGVCVFGIRDARWGEAIKAVVETRSGARHAPEHVKDFVGARIARFKRPNAVVFTDRLPRAADGSVDREAVKATWGDAAGG